MHQLAGPFPAGQTTEERLYLRLVRNPTTKAGAMQARRTNLLDEVAEALIEVRSRDAYFPLSVSLRPPTAF